MAKPKIKFYDFISHVCPFFTILYDVQCIYWHLSTVYVSVIISCNIYLHTEINGVPYFEIYVAANPSIRQQFSGAQPPETFVHVFNRLQLVAKV